MDITTKSASSRSPSGSGALAPAKTLLLTRSNLGRLLAFAIGDLHHAMAAGLLTRGGVRPRLGEIIAGVRPGQ